MASNRIRLVAFAQISVGMLSAASAHAAATKVTQSDWWGGVTGFPSYVNMYIYVPKTPAAKPPIVVVPHHCGGDASSSYSENSGLVTKADSVGFILIYPEATGQNCWDAGSPRSMNHSGTGDVPAIAQMVKYALAKYNGDAGRVYSVGGSSGGIVTEALLGVFPDVFTAGISIMGVPCGCWAEGYNDVTGKPSNGTGQWSGPCANGEVSKSAKAWGDLVRSYFPTYTGHRPRLQHWHGTSDSTLSYKNVAEDIKEWTNVLGLSETPTGSDSPKSGTTRQFWKNSCGYTVYETFSLSGVGHSVSVDAAAIATYFGLDDKATTADPETSACGSAGSGGSGNTGGTAAAGASSAVATAGRGNAQAGRNGQGLGGVPGVAGGPSAGGRASSGSGLPATAGGSANTARGTTTGVGGNSRNSDIAAGGSQSTGEPTPAGGRSSASVASNPSGGAMQTGNASSSGGSANPSSAASSRGGGLSSAGGSTAKASDSSSIAATAAGNQNPDSGCSCGVAARSTSHSMFSGIAMLFALCGLRLRRNVRHAARRCSAPPVA